MSIKHYFTILLAVLLLIGCGGDGVEGVVGEYQSAEAELPADDGIFDFTWSIIQQPDASILATDDLELSQDDHVISFIPDYAGNYIFEVIVSDEFGDEVSTQQFEFIITDSDESAAEDDEDLDDMEEEAEDSESDFYAEDTVEETYTPPPPPPEPVKQPVRAVSKPKPKPKPVIGADIPKDPLRYTIQVSAKRTFEEAQHSAEQFIQAGYDAYIQKAYFKETDEIWYRVRVGSFESYTTARNVAKEISGIAQSDIWVDHIRLEN